MDNPWKEIPLDDYEKHMSLNSVFQLQALNQMMKEQFYTYPVHSIMILGIAGGNGLEHIDRKVFARVYGVDINEDYLKECTRRYSELGDTLVPICADLTQDTVQLPSADLLVANLFIEYVGYECFQRAVEQVRPKYVSCVIQMNTGPSFVSESPYLHVFDRLDEVHHLMEEQGLSQAMVHIGYREQGRYESALPNGKKLVRLDFSR